MVSTRIGAGTMTADAGDGNRAEIDALIAQIVRANSGAR
jgi:hypothetical protein